MSALLQAKNLTFNLGSKPLFNDLSLTINKGDRIGLVGHNGAGKTSLLRLLNGHLTPDDGEILRRRSLTLATMEQFIPAELQALTLRDAVLDALPREDRLDYRADAILDALGFEPRQMQQSVERLSGGQQNIALFARAQIVEPDLILMDEPGNHMDVDALSALRSYLAQQRQLTFVMISHDRDLLEDCCRRTVFIRDQRTYSFDLPYLAAKTALAEQDEQAARRLATEEKEIERVRKSAKRLAQWGKVYDNEDLARKAKNMERRAQKLEDDKTFVSAGSGLALALSSTDMRSKTVFTLEEHTVSALDDGRPLVHCEYLVAKPGDRIALLGRNGVGKSTTIKSLLDADDTTVRMNPNVVIGYVDQDLAAFDTDKGRYDWLAARVNVPESQIKQTLLQAGINYADFAQPVNTLSGGEKARMMFMTLRLHEPNLIILDEPTNHIDLDSREQLESELQRSGATVLITSHDRRFLEASCNRFWVINNGKLTEFPSLDAYYEQVLAWDNGTSSPANNTAHVSTATIHKQDLDTVLARIDELEHLLQADRERKPKFQKPDKQAIWTTELDTLWQQVELMDRSDEK